MKSSRSTFRLNTVATAAALLVVLGTAACDATDKSRSNSSTNAQNVIVPADEMRGADRSGVANEMDARAAMHNEMSEHRAAGQGMGSMKDDHMGMGSGNMTKGQAPADPPKDMPMKDDM